MHQPPKETQSDPEVTIERTVEELEQKIAPASVEKIAINHNETLVRDKDEKTIDHAVEELEEKTAPVTVEKIILNHNENLVRDQDEDEQM